MAVKYHKCRDAEEVCEFINRRSKITVISISQQYTWFYIFYDDNQPTQGSPRNAQLAVQVAMA